METMGLGAARIIKELYDEDKVDGVVALGGGMGIAAGSIALKQLPIGVPKVLVSTMKLVQAGIEWYVDGKDIMVLPCPADLIGLNRVTKRVLAMAAYAVSGMVNAPPEREGRPLLAMTALGTTNRLASKLKDMFEARGFEVVVFHTVGPGGRAFEAFIEDNPVVCALDLSLNEVGNYLFGGRASAGPTRMEAAVKKGIPQVIVPGNVDFINFLEPESVPSHYRDRWLHVHNPKATVMRMSSDEMARIAATIAEKLNRSTAPVKVLIPLRGFSAFDREKGVFYDPKADMVFVRALKQNLRKEVEVIEVDAHINSDEFISTVFEETASLIRASEG
jgi:uncharacterized protein (UPF0261 family)